jgi:hypothetical protein
VARSGNASATLLVDVALWGGRVESATGDGRHPTVRPGAGDDRVEHALHLQTVGERRSKSKTGPEAEFANGFSHSTCLPASSAAMAISACELPGVQMSTMSTSFFAHPVVLPGHANPNGR